MDSRHEFSVRLAAKGTMAAVVIGGLFAAGLADAADSPHADDRSPSIRLPSNFDLGGATGLDPLRVAYGLGPQASAAPGPGHPLGWGTKRFTGISMPRDALRSDEA
jgi:hypothetical protein